MKKIAFLVATALFLGGCGDNTDTPVVKDVQNIFISYPESQTEVYSTSSIQLKASVLYDDGSSADITQAAGWKCDYSKASIFYGKLTPKVNGEENGSSTFVDISITYKTLADADDNLIKIIPLTALHIDDSNTSGAPKADVEYTFRATADYADATNSVLIDTNNSNNVTWSVEGKATIVTQGEGKVTIKFGTGDVNVTVSAFDINDTKHYTISN